MAISIQGEHSLIHPDQATERHVSMSNRLARAAQALNLVEKRLVAIGLAGTDSLPLKNLALAANSGWEIKVSALDYAEAFGLDPTTAYEQLKDASEKLFERYATYKIKDRRGKEGLKKFRWVSAATYPPGSGHVILNFSPEIAPHLLGLREQFTTYKLRHAAAFSSIYAWRLFELLKSWQSTGLYTVDIERFWDAMEAPPSCCKDFKALRTRIIEPAVAAICDKAGLVIEWKALRSGSRRVTGLQFTFGPDPQGRLDMGEAFGGAPSSGPASDDYDPSDNTPRLSD